MQRQFRALLCLKRMLAEGNKSLLTAKRICPIYAEPLQKGVPDLLSVFCTDKSSKLTFLCLTRNLGVPIFTKIHVGGDKLEIRS
jgi:hypothetical protein